MKYFLMKLQKIFWVLVVLIFECYSQPPPDKKMIILGIDGMDPKILQELMDSGKMPHFTQLAKEGRFAPLGSSIPPQSPVAWANFITGMDAGGHGIFDFVHRNPNTMVPYFSTSEMTLPSWSFSLRNWVIPLKSGKVKLMRQGKSFWEILENNGISTMILGIPSNFPPVYAGKSLSGMGTPDILGTYGEFTFITSDTLTQYKNISGGTVSRIKIIDNLIATELPGPYNTFKKKSPKTALPLSIYLDSHSSTVRILINNQDFILKEKEWSPWIPVEFEMIPYLSSVSGIFRLYLKQVRPTFQLYVSPININPDIPAMPITYPDNFSKKLFKELGYFYTQGMAENTKALEFGILSDDEYQEQAEIVFKERMRLFEWALKSFSKGLLFVYFSSLDQNSHMYWRARDPESAGYTSELNVTYGHYLDNLYMKMDSMLAKTMMVLDNKTTLIIMSDHGFAPFTKKVNLNTWLYKEGYITMFRQWDQKFDKFFQTVDWSRTRAYALGLNALYINLKGREINGSVLQEQKNMFVDEIAAKLLKLKDPETGQNIVKRVYKSSEVYHGALAVQTPDIIVGFARGYRISDASAMGEFPDSLVVLNTDKWSGDHCMAAEEVPGILLTNKPFQYSTPQLCDLTATILREFGISLPENMIGRSIFE